MTTESGSHGVADRAATDFRAYRAGDETALARLIDEVTPLLWHTARGCGLDSDSAQDEVQETWVVFYRSAGTIHEPQAVLGWLLTTVRRRAQSAAARGRREALPVEDEIFAYRSDDRPGPEDEAVAGAAGAALWQHFTALNERCRFLLRVLAHGDRPDYASISTALGMPVGSIGPTRGRCLATLRAALESDPHWSEMRLPR
ncbi:MAG: RNA polymerase sigma factor [Nocardioides sp.]